MIVLTNGSVLDGSGEPAFSASVLIEDGKIAAVEPASKPLPASAQYEVLDCSGLTVTPGFIDLHSHSDVQVLEARTEKLHQGVTTEIVGNCGFSPFPYTGDATLLREFGGGILGRSGDWGWPSAREYLQRTLDLGQSERARSLVGHGSLRVAVSGMEQRSLSSPELDRISGLLQDALDAGCIGFSTGLMYAPGSSADPTELEHLCHIVARKDKLYATHMRSYSSGLMDAVREQIALAERTGCRLQISHLQAAGRANWPLQEVALNEIEAARARGVDVEFDMYPYQCGSTVLTQFLPLWTLEGGTDALLGRLRDTETRRRILNELGDRGRAEWRDITISSVATSENAGFVGKNIAEIAIIRAQDPAECMLDLMLEEHGAINVISFNQSEDNLRQLITHPLCSVITDGFYVSGKPHPRLHGTYPELLGSLVRERKWLSLPEAIHKSTVKPAIRAGLADRGALLPGRIADLTIFDSEHISSQATYETPEAAPRGIVAVLKNGRVAYSNSDRLTR
jgi:N-acyl-D-amino-acid deacylase